MEVLWSFEDASGLHDKLLLSAVHWQELFYEDLTLQLQLLVLFAFIIDSEWTAAFTVQCKGVCNSLTSYPSYFYMHPPSISGTFLKNVGDSFQIQNAALQTINWHRCFLFVQKVWWTAVLCVHTPPRLCCTFTFTANQTLLQLQNILGFQHVFIFICTCTYLRGCFGSGAISSSKRWPMQRGVRVGRVVYLCVCVCVHTHLCYSASVLRSNANKSDFWNLKWQKPFSQSDVCLRIQCCVSFICGELISH